MTDAAKQLESNNTAATRRAGQTTGDKVEAERETTGVSASEGAAADNPENLGEMNTLERQANTHQEKKAELRATRAQEAQTMQTQATGIEVEW